MRDSLDYIVIWLPVCCGVAVFTLVGFMIRRNDEHMGRFQTFVRIFLSEGASLKTWGLFLSSFTLLLLLSGVVAKVANDGSWTKDLNVQTQRIGFFKDIALGLEILVSIVLAAFGAVAFKGQLPGGASFQLNQDAQGNLNQTITAPAVPPVPPAAPATGV